MKTVLLLQNNPEVLEYYQRQFRYVLVDEYQDTNYAQYVLTSLLAGYYENSLRGTVMTTRVSTSSAAQRSRIFWSLKSSSRTRKPSVWNRITARPATF